MTGLRLNKMGKQNKIVTVIPARGGSKGIPNKNVQHIGQNPLISYNIIASKNSDVDETWVSTDSDLIATTAQLYGAKVLMRPEKFAKDTSSSEEALIHFANNVDFDILVFLQCTSPLTTSEDINNGLRVLNSYDSVISVCKDHGGWLCGGFNWSLGKEKIDNLYQYEAEYNIKNRPRRQDMSPRFRENGAMYITTKKGLLESGCRLNGRIGLNIMPRQRSFEIDEPEDLLEMRNFLSG